VPAPGVASGSCLPGTGSRAGWSTCPSRLAPRRAWPSPRKAIW
jgi:hypothetical protein